MASGFLLRLAAVLTSFLEKRMGMGPFKGRSISMLTASSKVDNVTAGQESHDSRGSFLSVEAIPGIPWRSSLRPPSQARMAQRTAAPKLGFLAFSDSQMAKNSSLAPLLESFLWTRMVPSLMACWKSIQELDREFLLMSISSGRVSRLNEKGLNYLVASKSSPQKSTSMLTSPLMENRKLSSALPDSDT